MIHFPNIVYSAWFSHTTWLGSHHPLHRRACHCGSGYVFDRGSERSRKDRAWFLRKHRFSP